MSSSSHTPVNATTAQYCFLDLDFNHHRSKLARCAAFVHATDTRYGFSSKDLRQLGGSEVARIPDLYEVDHEWSDGGDIDVKPLPCGTRIVVQLYWETAPLACENFATLCFHGTKGAKVPVGDSGKPLTYRNSNVHRVQTDFVLQAGDFVKGNGSAGESIYSGKKVFKDERAGLQLLHDDKGVLSMGNSGKNSNSSQFFITFQATPQCNGKHVVFGRVVSGWSVLEHAHEVAATPTGTPPRVPVSITDCGLYTPGVTPGAGYWYDQPDEEAYSGISPVFMVRPRVAVVAPSETVMARFESALGTTPRVSLVESSRSVCDTDEDQDALRQQLQTLLDQEGVDVIVVAPACKDVVATAGLKAPRENMILDCKPVGALQAIQTQSWVAQQSTWQLDGV